MTILRLLAWDEFFYALIFTSTLAAKTAPVAISEFVGRYSVNITGMMAGGIMAAYIAFGVEARHLLAGTSGGSTSFVLVSFTSSTDVSGPTPRTSPTIGALGQCARVDCRARDACDPGPPARSDRGRSWRQRRCPIRLQLLPRLQYRGISKER
jgi:hypothetical protein